MIPGGEEMLGKQWWEKSVFSETKHAHSYYKFLCLLLIKI